MASRSPAFKSSFQWLVTHETVEHGENQDIVSVPRAPTVAGLQVEVGTLHMVSSRMPGPIATSRARNRSERPRAGPARQPSVIVKVYKEFQGLLRGAEPDCEQAAW